ncbi:hypothetical protein [Sediminicurvatus halobius]|uniref:Uncharacterized protein n=1 Tax=Sediminicurvatus halobius TaxID=2182432 RepID=A0A2U2N0W5_9GAMM|nr:hypothetical protein [Spiribacter halobius]PWG62826.1 hypothetical protein DEM34_10690 [Spiribacter halobius]UEX77025.1 hypothetical protein LMH63_13865 [Spiribacter halobius]
MSTPSYEAVTDEVRDVLAAAGRPLNIREIAARCDLADGIASLAVPLKRLREAGEVVVAEQDCDGPRSYRISDDGEARATMRAAGGTSNGASAPPADTGRGSLQRRLKALLAENPEGLTTKQIEQISAIPAESATKALGVMRRAGEVVTDTRRGRPGRWWLPDQAPSALQKPERTEDAPVPGSWKSYDDASEPSSEEAKPEAPAVSSMFAERHRSNVTPEPRGSMRVLETEGGREQPKPSHTGPTRYAYRSDGTLLIEKPGRDPLELDREAAERLYRYLTGIHDGVQAALGGDA